MKFLKKSRFLVAILATTFENLDVDVSCSGGGILILLK